MAPLPPLSADELVAAWNAGLAALVHRAVCQATPHERARERSEWLRRAVSLIPGNSLAERIEALLERMRALKASPPLRWLDGGTLDGAASVVLMLSAPRHQRQADGGELTDGVPHRATVYRALSQDHVCSAT